MEYEIDNVPYLDQNGALPYPEARSYLIYELRRRGAVSPYSRNNPESRPEDEYIDQYAPSDVTDRQEYERIKDVADSYYEDYPDEQLFHWLVTLHSGTRVSIFTNQRGASDIGLDHDIRRIDEMGDEQSLEVIPDEPQIYQQTQRDMQQAQQEKPRRRVRLPGRGKHAEPLSVTDIAEYRKRYGPHWNPPPGWQGDVRRMPQHRRRGDT